MRPLTVMIGANGVGKTSFLEIFSLLAASARGKLKNAISKLGGFQALVTCGLTSSLSVQLSMDVPGYKPLNYQLTLGNEGIAYAINSETLSQKHEGDSKPFKYIDSDGVDIKYWGTKDGKLLHPNWEYYVAETALSQVPRMYKEPESFRNQISSCTYYSAYALDVGYGSPIRLPQTMQPANHPGDNGEELVACLYYLREIDRERFETIEDTLTVAFPGFKRLNFPPVAAGTLTMTWEDENFPTPLYMNQLSEGTLRFLWLVTLLYSPSLTAITLIDEPEVSLHPELLNILRDAMREASKHTQLIISTHSDRLIGFLEPSEVLILDSEEGVTTMTWADSEEFDLDRWLQDYSLDELWRMGHLRGRA
ncbi:MAG: AAA family ATPase [bacterium]|nr:AAA family ATPase [bacterium]